MWALAVRDTAALVNVQLLGRPWSQHPIRIGPDVKRAKAAQLAGANDLAHGLDMWTVALRVAAQEFDFVLLRSFDHLFGFRERDRHGFFHDDVLAVVGGRNRVGRVKPVWRGDPNRFDVRIGAKLFNTVVGLRAVAVLKSIKHPPVYVRRCHELDVGHRLHLRQDLRRADADADDTDLQSASNRLVRVYLFYHRQSPSECELPLRILKPLFAIAFRGPRSTGTAIAL